MVANKRKNSIDSLVSLYTVVIGVALSLSAILVVGKPEGIQSISGSEILLFLAFSLTLIPFYHGARRHLDDAYLENPNPEIKDYALIIDVLLLFLHGMTFVVLAQLLNKPSQFAWVLLTLLSVDVIWGIGAHFGWSSATSGAAEGKWAAINFVFVMVSAVPLVVLDIGLKPYLYPNKLAFTILVVCLIRTGLDYGICWDFYFPKQSTPDL